MIIRKSAPGDDAISYMAFASLQLSAFCDFDYESWLILMPGGVTFQDAGLTLFINAGGFTDGHA